MPSRRLEQTLLIFGLMNVSSVLYMSLKRQEPTRLSQLQKPSSLCADMSIFVIMNEAVTSLSRSSPILMGWWSAQRNDYRSLLMELANTTSSVKGSTKRGTIVQARAASPSIWSAFTHFMNDETRRGFKASTVAMSNLLHQGEDTP
jgi:hypothetical protein